MRRHTALLIAPFLLLPVNFGNQPLHAQQHRAAAPTAEEKTTDLPVTRVSLYKNGVGFFEHTGHVTGNAAVTIDFTSGQLNDVLQSLTAIDLNGGRISGADYNSTTPLAQQLSTLPLALDGDPTIAGFYSSIRGSRVEVRNGTTSITGRLLSVETGDTITSSKAPEPDAPQKLLVTVISDSGEVRTVAVTTTTTIRLLDPALDANVTRYLKLLDANRSQGLRHLTLEDLGTGSRELKVSYISEVPIWKSTYRILFSESNKNTATLQGWSVVDNTTGTDWLNVHLSLIAGAPQSFIQPLSQPIYSHRPEIPIAQEAQLTPQTFESGEDKQESIGAGHGNGAARGMLAETLNVTADSSTLETSSSSVARVRGASAPAKVPNSYHGVAAKSYGFVAGAGMAAAPPPPPAYEDLASASFTANTQSNAFDDFFAYSPSDPVTIRKNESALVPILQAKVSAERVTLVHSNGYQTTQPLRALWLTNSSNLTLDRGSFSIVEDGNFGGEGLLDPIHAGEKRLLSYAADQAIHVSTEGSGNSSKVAHISAAKGVLTIQRAEHTQLTYVIRNAAADTRSIILETSVQPGYTLDPSIKPDETTPTVYRFRINASAGETVRETVSANHRGFTTYQLTNTDENQFALILQQLDNNPKVAAAIAPILEARRKVADTDAAVDQTTTQLENLHTNEDRQRANITALAATDKSAAARFVHDLNATEDQIIATQKELDTRTAAKEAAEAELANRIEAFQLNEAL